MATQPGGQWATPLTWLIVNGSVELPLAWQAVSVLSLLRCLWLLIRPVLDRCDGQRARPGGFRRARHSNAISSTRPAWTALAVAAGIVLAVDAISPALVFTTLDEVMAGRPVSDFDSWLLERQKTQSEEEEEEVQQDNSDAPPADDAQLGEWADAQLLEPFDDDEPEFHPEYEPWDLVSQRNGPAVKPPLVNRRPAAALVAALLMILGWLMVLPPSFMT